MLSRDGIEPPGSLSGINETDGFNGEGSQVTQSELPENVRN